MKTIFNTILLTGALAMTTTGLAAANNDWFEQWYQAKHGRSSPSAEARLQAERQSTAFREESRHTQPTQPNWIEDHFKGKLGRNTPAEEARLRAEREASAFRQEPARETTPATTWFEQWYRAKYGRYPGK